MARFIGHALAGRRVVPSMECALVCLLVALSILGSATDLDRKVRSATSGLIAGLYDAEIVTASNSPAPPKVTVRVQAQVAPQR